MILDTLTLRLRVATTPELVSLNAPNKPRPNLELLLLLAVDVERLISAYSPEDQVIAPTIRRAYETFGLTSGAALRHRVRNCTADAYVSVKLSRPCDERIVQVIT